LGYFRRPFVISKVFVVYKSFIGGGLFVYAVCTSEYSAKLVRRKAAGFAKGARFYDVDPESSPYASQLRILKVEADKLFSLGILSRVGQGSKEVLA
jgi:hypothetical protein